MNKTPDAAAPAFIEAIDIHKAYDNGREQTVVLKGVNLRIGRGSFTAVVGPSGAGKSTLLHILGGLDEPTQGAVLFEGEDICGFNDARISEMRNRRVGFVFQFYHLLSEFTVLENVVMPGLIRRDSSIERKEFYACARDLLARAGLADKAGHFPAQLSGGERQRAALVRGLINRPSVLFCDEPTGNLDSHTGDGIFALIKKASADNNMAVVLVTHNMDLARQAQVVYHLRDGALVN